MLRLMRKGQSTAEYAIVVGLVIAAVVGMQVYVKRGIQGKFKDASDASIKEATDDSGSNYGVNTYEQYEPKYSTTTTMALERDATEKATTSLGGGVKREIVGEETSSKTGKQEILAPE